MDSPRPAFWSTAKCCPIWRSTSLRPLRALSRRPKSRSRRDTRRTEDRRRRTHRRRFPSFLRAGRIACAPNMPMIDTGYVQRMARYNCWQNQNLYGVADVLADTERRRNRGAFFGSIHATLNHLLWADRIWMHRLAGTPKPGGGITQSVFLRERWDDLKRERVAFDGTIVDWADGLDPSWLDGDLTWYSGAAKRD